MLKATVKNLHFSLAVMITLPKNTSELRLPYIKDGGLSNTYIFSQAHFHWGSDSSRGSEHTIRKKT